MDMIMMIGPLQVPLPAVTRSTDDMTSLRRPAPWTSWHPGLLRLLRLCRGAQEVSTVTLLMLLQLAPRHASLV